MVATQGIRAGGAFVEVFLKDNRLRRGLDRAAARLKAFGGMVRSLGTKFLALGTAMLAPLGAAAKVFASAGDQLDKMRARTGISAQALSELGFAAEQGGASIDQLDRSLAAMARFSVMVERGLATATDLLDMLGVSVERFKGATPEERFMLLAEAISTVEDPTLRAGIALNVFGRSGRELLPMLEGGAAGIEALRAEARRLGITLSDEDATAAAELTDAMNRLSRQLKAIVVRIGAALAPALTAMQQRIAPLIASVIDWIKVNKTLILTAAKIAAVVLGAGAALVALGSTFSAMGAVLGGISSAIGLVGTVIGALLSPIGLVIAGLAAFAVWFVTATETGGKALDWLVGKFFALRDFALAAFGGIADALAAGDIGLAAKILWLTLQVAWQKGIGVLKGYWIEWKTFFLRVFNEAVFSLAGFFTDAWAALQVAWVESVAFMADAWTLFTSTLTKGWRTAQNFISKGVLRLMALFDDTIDVEAAGKILDEDMARANRELEQEVNQTILARDQKRQAERAQIEADRQGARGVLDEQRAAEESKLAGDQQAALDASQNALSEARREWQAAIDEAARKRAALPETEDGPSLLERFGKSLSGAGGEISGAMERNVEVQGTFNALAAVRGLAAGSAADRTAKATEETAKNTKRLLQEVQQGGLAFE